MVTRFLLVKNSETVILSELVSIQTEHSGETKLHPSKHIKGAMSHSSRQLLSCLRAVKRLLNEDCWLFSLSSFAFSFQRYILDQSATTCTATLNKLFAHCFPNG